MNISGQAVDTRDYSLDVDVTAIGLACDVIDVHAVGTSHFIVFCLIFGLFNVQSKGQEAIFGGQIDNMGIAAQHVIQCKKLAAQELFNS